MKFFEEISKTLNNVYEEVVNVFKKAADSTGIAVFSFGAVTLFLFLAALFFVLLGTRWQAREMAAFKKANKLIKKKEKGKLPEKVDFNNALNNALSKKRTRVKALWQSFKAQNTQPASMVMSNTVMYPGLSEKRGGMLTCGFLIAFLLFFISLAKTPGLLLVGVFEALVFPVIIIVLAIIFNFFYRLHQNKINLGMVKQQQILISHIDAALSGQVITSQPAEKTSYEETEVKTETLPPADLSEGINESAEFLESSLEIENKKEEIESQLIEERERGEEKKKDFELELEKTRLELENLKKEAREANDAALAASLKEREESQAKLIEALEKLKAGEERRIRENEERMQTELAKLDLDLRKKKLDAETQMERELEEWRKSTLRTAAANQPPAPMPMSASAAEPASAPAAAPKQPETQAVSAQTNKTITFQENKENLDKARSNNTKQALSGLLEAMNAYQTKKSK